MKITDIPKIIFSNNDSKTDFSSNVKDEKFFDAKFNDMDGLQVERTNDPQNIDDKITIDKSDDGLSETKYRGDDPIEYTERRRDGSLKQTTKQIDNGNFEVTVYRKDGSVYSKGEYKDYYEIFLVEDRGYDEKGNLIEKRYNDGASRIVEERYEDGKLRVKDIYDARSRNRLIERTLYNRDGSFYLNSKYNSKGQIVENTKAEMKDKPEFDKFNANDLDGDLDDGFKQGMSGTCYFVSTIQSLLNTKKGREILNKSISYDKENKISTIRFLGVGKEYQFTEEEIKEAMGRLGSGDPDFVALTLGYEKYRTETFERIVDGGYSSEVMKALCGEDGDSNIVMGFAYITMNNKDLDNLQEKMQTGNYAVTVHTPNMNVETEFSEEDREMGLVNTHAYSLKSVTDKTVTVINPTTQQEITMSREKFLSSFVTFNELELK